VDYFPFDSVGFRANPFRRLTDDEWAAVAVLPDELLRFTDRRSHHVQVLGGPGRGKTTCLLGLAARLRCSGLSVVYEYLAAGQDCFRTPLDAVEVFLLDEAQRLRSRERGRLLAAAGHPLDGPRLVMGTHEDLTAAFARRGLALATVGVDSVTTTHVAMVLARRLAHFTVDERPGITFSADAVRYLSQAFRGNLRLIEGFLYEVFQDMPPRGILTMDMLAGFKADRQDPAGEYSRPVTGYVGGRR
jgi:hypothetical protein